MTRLDHVALWMADRDAIADFAVAHLGMHVIERTDRFTLVGADARRGKLTLFAAPGARERGLLEHVAFRVSDLGQALARLPEPLALEEREGLVAFEIGEGLRVALAENGTDLEYDLDHVALLASEPERVAEAWLPLGFGPAASGPSGAPRVEAGGAFLELRAGSPPPAERPLLNHIALLVESADEWRAEAEDLGVEIADVVDAPNTYAVFVLGPEGVKLEYVEHKPSFSLT
jgi:catechol 2,3-dioxygenase-like lactoylglutathione lyase family enzyme